MSSITIENWKVVDDSSPEFEFIPPEYTVTYWEIPKWWYKGDEVCYTSCVRIDVGQTSVYVDGTSPLMKFTLNWTAGGEGTASFTDWRAIDRALILEKDNLGAVNRDESDEYIDVEFNDYFYKVRYDNYFGPDIEVPLQADEKPVWVDGNDSRPYYLDPIPFITGTFVGGIEPITYEYRHKEQVNDGAEWTTPTDFLAQTNTPTELTIQVDGKSKAQKIHIETKATDAEGTVVYNNGPYLTLNNPVVRITENPVISSFNQYVVGEEVVGFAGAFTGGAPGAYARSRWRWRASKDDNYTGDVWTTNVEPLQEVRSSPIPEGMIQAQFQYQVIEPNTNTGNGNRQSNKTTQARDVTDPPEPPPQSTSWGAVIVYVNGEEYNTFIGPAVNVRVGDPINMKVEWEGDATGNILWDQRSGGSAFIDDPQNPEPEITMTAAGYTTVTVALTDPSGLANPPSTSKIVNFWAYIP